jgi:hypothetical protein
MEIKDYQSNSYKLKEKSEQVEEKKKLEKVVVGQVKTQKKSGFSKFVNGFVSDDAHNIKSYLFKDVVVPTIKKTITDVVDMILYGGSKRSSRIPGTKVSYRSYWDEPRDSRPVSRVSSGYDYEDIILDSAGDANMVLDQLNDIIDTYKIASVADLYDLVGISGNFTDNKYGWTNLANADIVRTRDGGYKLKLPRALPIK